MNHYTPRPIHIHEGNPYFVRRDPDTGKTKGRPASLDDCAEEMATRLRAMSLNGNTYLHDLCTVDYVKLRDVFDQQTLDAAIQSAFSLRGISQGFLNGMKSSYHRQQETDEAATQIREAIAFLPSSE